MSKQINTIMLQSKVSEWQQVGATEYKTPEGVTLKESNLSNVCEYYGVPSTLLNIDKSYNTNTFQQIASKKAPVVSLITDETTAQVLDPKSKFLPDDKFELLVEKTKQYTGVEPEIKKNGFSTQAYFTVPDSVKDEFIGDAFTKSFRIERLPQGGLDLTTQLLRLVCTNGLMLPEKQYHSVLRKAEMPNEVMTAFYDSVANLNVNNYLQSLFTKNGQPIQASVSDYLGMASTLRHIEIDADIEMFFPTDEIARFYSEQGVDIASINRSILNRLPSGLHYYQCFNILTHAAKLAPKTIKNEIEVAKWCKPSKMKQLSQSEISVKGTPVFDQALIKTRMGDR